MCRSESFTGTTTVACAARFFINEFYGMDEVVQEFFSVEPPAQTTGTMKIFPPDVLLEIDAVALKS